MSSEERPHLVGQLNLLTEQKIAKLVSYIEKLHTDLSNVHNRDGSEAKVMKQSTDFQTVLGILEIGNSPKNPNHLSNK
jgi:uncharacterized membrane protein